MSKIDVIQLDRDLRQGKILSFYFIVGEEAHLALGAQKRIEKAVAGDSPHDNIRTVFEGKELSIHKFSDAFKSLPLFGTRQLVTVKNAQSIGKETQEKIVECFEETSKSSTAIFIADKLDGRSRLMQAASKHTQVAVVECKPLYPNQLPSWINMEIQRHGKRISQEAAGYLADLVGTDLGSLAQAIEHATLYVGTKPTVELNDVEEAIAETTQRSIFELTDAIGHRNEGRSLAVLKNLLDHGTQPILILNMIARHFRILTKAKEIEGRGSSYEVASYLGVKPFFAKTYLEQSRKFEADELKQKFKILSLCDRELKSSRIPKERILEKMIMEL